MKRLDRVIKILVKHKVEELINKKLPSPEKLRKIVEELGGTYVQLALYLSRRPDILPYKYLKELAKAKENITYTNTKFKGIEVKKPIKSNSITQLNKAKVKRHDALLVTKRLDESLVEEDIDIIENFLKKDPYIIRLLNEFKIYIKSQSNPEYRTHRLDELRYEFIEVKTPSIYKANEEKAIIEELKGNNLKKANNKQKLQVTNLYLKQMLITGKLVVTDFEDILVNGEIKIKDSVELIEIQHKKQLLKILLSLERENWEETCSLTAELFEEESTAFREYIEPAKNKEFSKLFNQAFKYKRQKPYIDKELGYVAYMIKQLEELNQEPLYKTASSFLKEIKERTKKSDKILYHTYTKHDYKIDKLDKIEEQKQKENKNHIKFEEGILILTLIILIVIINALAQLQSDGLDSFIYTSSAFVLLLSSYFFFKN